MLVSIGNKTAALLKIELRNPIRLFSEIYQNIKLNSKTCIIENQSIQTNGAGFQQNKFLREHFVVNAAFCNKIVTYCNIVTTVVFCNKNPDAFCNLHSTS